MINHNFDERKKFEENVLKILNEHSTEQLKNPCNSENFKLLYQKQPQDARKKFTLFIDIGDTLANVSLYKTMGYFQKEITTHYGFSERHPSRAGVESLP